MDYDDIFSSPAYGVGRPAKHPFKTMNIGDVLTFEDRKMQGYAHTYGQKSGRKFQTRFVDGVVYVKRIA